MPGPYLSHLEWIGIGKETTQGTAVAASLYIPVSSVKPEDLVEEVKDQEFVGNATLLRAAYAGVKDSTVDLDGFAFNEAFGHWMVGLGLADTVTGSGPYVHTFKLTNAQPPTYTILEQTIQELRQWPGQMLDECAIKIDAKGAITWANKYKGFPSLAAGTGTPAFPTSTPFLPWQTTATLGGVATARMLSFELTAKRSVEPIHPLDGQQAPSQMFAGPIEATGKATFLFVDDTEINHLLNYDEPALVVTSSQGSSPILQLSFNKGAFIKAVRDVSKSYVEVTVDIDGVYNATDAGPFSCILTNSQSTAY